MEEFHGDEAISEARLTTSAIWGEGRGQVPQSLGFWVIGAPSIQIVPNLRPEVYNSHLLRASYVKRQYDDFVENE